jgi:hypothetical protein
MRCNKLLAIATGASVMMPLASGCQSSREGYGSMMWYRPSKVAVASPNSISVGCYGREAEFGVWPGSGVSGEWTDRPLEFGRAGRSAEISTIPATGVGGEPIANYRVSGISGSAGASLGVAGGSATVGESTYRDGASYGTTP